MIHFIYLIKNKINGHMYIGQTINLKKRWSEHKRPSRNSTVIEKAFNKYGEENFSFEVLEKLNSQDEANNREQYWIAFYNTYANPIHYNMHIGGNAQNGENNPMYGLKGEMCPTSKVKKDIGVNIYNEYKKNIKHSIYSLSEKYQLSTTVISEICSGKHFTTAGMESVLRDNVGENRKNCLPKEECLEIYNLYKTGINDVNVLAKSFKVSTAVIREICQGIHWSVTGKENLMIGLHTSSKITKEIGFEILQYYLGCNQLKQTFENFKDTYNVSYRTVQRICSKQHWSVCEVCL